MSRYIDADVLKDDLIHNRSFYPAMVASAIKNTPTADVVEVVRCRDCANSKHWYADKRMCFFWNEIGIGVHNYDYCSYGERKETI